MVVFYHISNHSVVYVASSRYLPPSTVFVDYTLLASLKTRTNAEKT